MVATAAAAAAAIAGGGGDIICLGVILPIYAFVLGGRKWNCAPTAINEAGLHLHKEDLL